MSVKQLSLPEAISILHKAVQRDRSITIGDLRGAIQVAGPYVKQEVDISGNDADDCLLDGDELSEVIELRNAARRKREVDLAARQSHDAAVKAGKKQADPPAHSQRAKGSDNGVA
jgi:hypothetical protein